MTDEPIRDRDEVEPDPTLEAEPTVEATAEPVVEATAEAEPVLEVAPVVERDEAVEAEPAVEAGAEPESVPEAAPTPKAAPTSEAALAPEAAPTSEAALAPEPAPEAGPAPVVEAEPESEPALELQPAAEATSAPQPVPVAPPEAPRIEPSLTRRAFLGFGLTIAGGLAGAGVLSRLVPVFDEPAPPPIVPAYDPAAHAWTFVVDSSACIGCGMCVVACKDENHVPQEAAYTRTWVERHTVTTDGAHYVDAPDAGAHGFPTSVAAVEADGKQVASSFFEPRLCMQCESSPCTAVCPVGATYRTADGVILVDSRRCIGCGYCVVACPYGARYLVPAGEDAPNGTPGVADKCTWCYHRISQGRLPACVEVCPVGARRFGDAADPNSEIAVLVRERRPRQLHPEYGTRPRVLYLGPSVEEA